MAEYIERETATERINSLPYPLSQKSWLDGVADAIGQIKATPAADVAPVRHGRWLHRKNGVAYCSECEVDTVEDETNYCPNCGAKMDLED